MPNSWEEINLRRIEALRDARPYAMPSGSIVMCTEGKEVAINKDGEGLEIWESISTTIANVAGLTPDENNCLFVTII